MPVHSRADCDNHTLPELRLPPMADAWLGWKHSAWQGDWERFRSGDGPLPASAVVTGLDLESSLRRELERGNVGAAEPLALWLAFRARASEALEVVADNKRPTARRLAGLILWRGLRQLDRAVAHLEAGPLHDPVAVKELDELYTELGQTDKRRSFLEHSEAHRLVVERKAHLLLETGRAREALQLLASTSWPKEHQRYVRTELWKRAKSALGEADAKPPDYLGEDDLARFGAYWSDR
jgi:hypothetical protein